MLLWFAKDLKHFMKKMLPFYLIVIGCLTSSEVKLNPLLNNWAQTAIGLLRTWWCEGYKKCFEQPRYLHGDRLAETQTLNWMVLEKCHELLMKIDQERRVYDIVFGRISNNLGVSLLWSVFTWRHDRYVRPGLNFHLSMRQAKFNNQEPDKFYVYPNEDWLIEALRTVLPVKPNECHFRSHFCYNFASETPTEFIFSQLVDFANVTLSNALNLSNSPYGLIWRSAKLQIWKNTCKKTPNQKGTNCSKIRTKLYQ